MLREDNVIDNKNVVLKEELLKILPKTKNASIAVGYFFISGLSAVVESLQGVDKVRLLISNTTDKATAESLIEGFHSINQVNRELGRQSHVNDDRRDRIRDDSKNNIKKSLEYMSQTSGDKKTVMLLIEMMKTSQMEVRVYPKEKLHAKAYIFQPRDTDFAQGLGIVGSSNLSLAGISHNSELNLKTFNAPDVNQLLSWFDELWEEGLDFTEDFNILLSESWAGTTYSPRDVFLKAAYLEYKDRLEDQHEIDPIWGTTFPQLFPFQRNAVDQCLTMIESYGGVIIGDVVGLGKTYVGTALLKYLQLQDYRPLIICPPPLEPMWEKFCVDYEVDAKILSRGKLSQDSFELYQDYRYKDRDLVLLDESHHFRNNDSRQYENLQQFTQARDAKVILLTATPFSNEAKDIKNQIMLFHQSEKTQIPPANETDLNRYFVTVKKGEADLVDLLRHIMIRRTRRYVLKQWGDTDENGRDFLKVGDQDKYFPSRKMKTQRYDINKVYQNKYETILECLQRGELTFARYSIGLYVKDEYTDVELYKELGAAGTKLIGLIRTILLKRMESSLEAFQESIAHYIKTHEIFLKLLEEKIIPIGDVSYKSIHDLIESDSDYSTIYDPETIDEFRKKIEKAGETKYKFEAFKIEELTRDIENDIKIFNTIDGLIHRLSYKTDDKLKKLQELLDKEYVGKKVLIFSEFTTTARYLDKHLKWKGHKEQVDSTTGNMIQCARRFDPDNNPSSEKRPDKSEEISLLISTDVLSEGVNLQAGQVIINYDFHWNPTRLIQRAGRVDRIGSKNEFVTVHNFLLDPDMEKDFRLEEHVDRKIDSIQQKIGEDYPILKPGEPVNTKDTYAIYKGDVSILDHEEENPLEPSRFEKMLTDVQMNSPQLWEDFTSIPDGIRGSDGTETGGVLLLACESGTERSGKVRKYYLVTPNEKVNEISSQKALEILESEDKSTHATPSSHDSLVAAGWRQFVEESEQIRARASSTKLTRPQKWIREKLMKMDKNDTFTDKRQEIETLLKAYSIPILKGKLNRELTKITKAGMEDMEILGSLSQLYLHYNLQNQVRQDEEEATSPRILYSMYVGKHD